MNSLDGVSKRHLHIYNNFYSDREAQRAENLFKVFSSMARAVEAIDSEVSLDLDYMRLGELVRSYFLDTIRYKEYHFNPDPKDERFAPLLAELGYNDFSEIDPLSADWTRLVHGTANINASKVATYTVKWVLTYKPISVVHSTKIISVDPDDTENKVGRSLEYFASINEHYALSLALLALGVPLGKINPKKVDELIYNFRFRRFDEASFFMVFTPEYLLGTT